MRRRRPLPAHAALRSNTLFRWRSPGPARKASEPMGGIAGIVNIKGRPITDLQRRLELQSSLLAHRGPDGSGLWFSPRQDAGFCHRRLAIIDLTDHARQPMRAPNGTVVTYNGEIYNYL